MKKSLSVPLVCLGTLGSLASLTGCDKGNDVPAQTEVQVKQDFYTSLEDCQRDWGSDPLNCRAAMGTTEVDGQTQVSSGFTGQTSPSTSAGDPATAAASGQAVATGPSAYPHGYGYSGPRYYWFRNEQGGYPVALEPNGQTRAIANSRINADGARFAERSWVSHSTIPGKYAASADYWRTTRSGFGRTASSLGHSSGG